LEHLWIEHDRRLTKCENLKDSIEQKYTKNNKNTNKNTAKTDNE